MERFTPLTEAAFGKPGDPPGPSPIEREWGEMAVEGTDLILCWAGRFIRGQTGRSWHWISWHVGVKHPHPALSAPAANVERMLSPLAHEARVRLMQALYPGPKSSAELAEATGLRGGNLYYHLKELVHAAYVTEGEGKYDLTPLGGQLLVTFSVIAHKLVEDRGPEGLVISLS
jgi:DNA-binding transcriptional ArsR family regulator